jgi:hypothetical protein
MRVAVIFLQRPDQADDAIYFDTVHADPDRIRITYRDGASLRGARYTFFLEKSAVSSYVSDVLFGLRRDADPFEFIQSMPAICPSVLYHISDLEDYDVCQNICRSIQASCNMHISTNL